MQRAGLWDPRWRGPHHHPRGAGLVHQPVALQDAVGETRAPPGHVLTEVVVSSLNLTELGAPGGWRERQEGLCFLPFWKFKALGLVPRNQQGRVGP